MDLYDWIIQIICITVIYAIIYLCLVCIHGCSRFCFFWKSNNDEIGNPMNEEHYEMTTLESKPTEAVQEDVVSADNHVSESHLID